MKVSILTIMPELFGSFLDGPVLQRAVRKGALSVEIIDIRDSAPGSFRHIDDSPFGGGAGMVMRCQPVLDALRACRGRSGSGDPGVRTVILSPAGTPYTQQKARSYAGLDHLILICGHYEGMDARTYPHADEQVSIGDYVLTGGELAAQVITDSVTRLLPGSLRDASTEEESFENGLLEYPQYTQPREYEGMAVPEVLVSGNHRLIHLWKFEESLKLTKRERPDLFDEFVKNHRGLDKDEQKVMEKVIEMM